MDLSFKFDRESRPVPVNAGLAVLLVGIAARQAASPTAGAQAQLSGSVATKALLTPRDGAFSLAASGAVTPRKDA